LAPDHRCAQPQRSPPSRSERGTPMLDVKRSGHLRREIAAADRIPYSAHVASRVVRTIQGDYLQAFRLGGASFESSDDAQLNNWHERLNVLWRNIANPSVALWTHIIRRHARLAAPDHSEPESRRGGFAEELHSRYQHRLRHETLMVNELYLSILYRPVAGKAAGFLSQIILKTQRDGRKTALADALDACEKLSQTVAASLARYEPESLGCYRRGGVWYSSLLEYLALLINGERQRMPL